MQELVTNYKEVNYIMKLFFDLENICRMQDNILELERRTENIFMFSHDYKQ